MASENGWEPARLDPASPLLVWKTVPGTDVSLQVRNDDAGTIMLAYAADYHANVQPLRDADSACYTPTNSVATSNHLNATAMDLDWDDHTFQVSYAGYTPQMIAAMRALLEFYDGVMFWAQDWDEPKDCMHHQMAYDSYGNTADFVNQKIRADGFSTYKRGGTPIGGTTPAQPAQPAQTAAVTALYDAVPVIAEDRAAQLVDVVIAGLAAAQCTNVKRIAMFLAQTGWESDGYNTTEEYADGSEYEGRCSDLGNCSPGDGVKYKGRTWIQITGKAHYAEFGKWAAGQGLVGDPNQFVNDPTSLGDIKWAGIGAAWYWTVARPGINTLCDAGDLVGVTKAINGGTNGLEDPSPGVPGRRSRYNQALALGTELLALIETPTAPTSGGTITLADISQDDWNTLIADVKEIRAQLNGDGTFDTGSSPGAVKRVEDDHASGKPMSLLDIATWLKNHVSTHKAPTP